MTDITSTHLEAALIDQKVAGAFRGKVYAFVAVPASDGYWQLGVAVSHERGYSPISGKTFTTNAEAKRWAEGLNFHIGLSADRAAEIVISSMVPR